jgi:hypothetical protein
MDGGDGEKGQQSELEIGCAHGFDGIAAFRPGPVTNVMILS